MKLGKLEIDGYHLEIFDAGPYNSIKFTDKEDAPLHGMIGEVTQENRQPDENWEKILNREDKSGIAFAYWILEEGDEDRESFAFMHYQKKWKKAKLNVTKAPIWNVRTSWDPESAFIPHDTLIKILKIARELRFGAEIK